MPVGQVCGECRQPGHNRATCSVLIAGRESKLQELQALVETQSRDLSRWEKLVEQLYGIIRQQKQDLELEGVINQGLREELQRKDQKIRQLEGRLRAFAVHSDPRRY